MSRIGPGGQAAARTPQRRPAEQEPYDPYAAPQGQGQQPYGQQPYGQPHAGQSHGGQQHSGQLHGGQAQATQPGGYWGQPEHGGYGEPSRQQAYSGQGHGQQPAQQPAQGYGQQRYADSAYDRYPPQAKPQGYPAQSQAPFVPAPHPFTQPQGYGQDYDPPTQPPRGYTPPAYGQELDAPTARSFAPQPPAPQMPFDRFPQPQAHAGYGQQAPQQGWGQSAHDPRFDLGGQYGAGAAHVEPPFEAPQDPFNHPHQEYADPEAAYDEGEYEEEEEEEPRSGRRTLVIVAALVGAIGLGGAMAYMYKNVLGGNKTTVARAVDNPVKTNAGSVNSDKKVASRLDEPPKEAGANETPNEDPGAPKRVRIIPITPGNDQPETAATSPPAAQPIPGIMLDMSNPPQRPQAQPNQGPAPIARVPAPPPVAMAPEPAPKPAAQAPVRTVAVNPPARTDATPPAAAPKKVAKVRQRDDHTASIPASSASGYVAVLASQKSRMDALKAFADLQQKHNDVLGTKTPDVQEANLGDKGTWYRAVVGPPGSREAAANLCSQLKSVGYNGCWVTTY